MDLGLPRSVGGTAEHYLGHPHVRVVFPVEFVQAERFGVQGERPLKVADGDPDVVDAENARVRLVLDDHGVNSARLAGAGQEESL